MSCPNLVIGSFFFILGVCFTSLPSSNYVDSLLLVAHNERGEKVGNAERQMMWGNCGFKWRMLELHLSDLDNILYRHTLGDEERSYVSTMSVVIMGAEICRWTGFGRMKNMIVDGV